MFAAFGPGLSTMVSGYADRETVSLSKSGNKDEVMGRPWTTRCTRLANGALPRVNAGTTTSAQQGRQSQLLAVPPEGKR